MEPEENVSRRRFLRRTTTAAGLTAVSPALGNAKKAEPTVFVPTGQEVKASNVKSQPNAGVGVRPEEAKAAEKPITRSSGERQMGTTSEDVHKWLASVEDQFYNGAYSHMHCDFTVPEKPHTYESVNYPNMFYFPGLQNCETLCSNPTYIVQPVLQWNWYDNDKGEGYPGEWAISAWWAQNNDTWAHGDIIQVEPGDTLYGYLDYKSDGRWYIEIYNYRTGEYSDLYTPDFSSYSWDRSTTTLEGAGYDEGDCNQLPGECTFKNIYFEDMNGNGTAPEWNANQNNSCNASPEARSNSETHIDTPWEHY